MPVGIYYLRPFSLDYVFQYIAFVPLSSFSPHFLLFFSNNIRISAHYLYRALSFKTMPTESSTSKLFIKIFS